jgi:fructooligosaccharide transport system permease protein
MKKKNMYFNFFGKNYLKHDAIVGWAFLLPAFMFGIIFVILPMFISLSYAFTDAYMLKLNDVNFKGIDNFVKVFKDIDLYNALGNTIEFVLKVVPIQLCVSLSLALILNSTKIANTFFRWAFFTPVMLSLAVTSFLWMNLFNEQEGLINALIIAFGGQRQLFLNSPNQAMNIIVFISVWQGAGYQMLIFLSGLKNVPQELYESASIDGSNKKQSFLYITIPMIKPTFSFVLITMLIGAFRLIIQPMIMTQGGPSDSTMTMSYYIYQQGITYRDVGYSSAVAMVFTVLIATIALTLRKVIGEENS